MPFDQATINGLYAALALIIIKIAEKVWETRRTRVRQKQQAKSVPIDFESAFERIESKYIKAAASSRAWNAAVREEDYVIANRIIERYHQLYKAELNGNGTASGQ